MQPSTAEPASQRRWFSTIVDRLPMVVFWALAAQGVISVSRFLTTMTVGGRFAPDETPDGVFLGSAEQLGYYSAAFSALMILIAFHEAFVTTPLTVFLPRQEKERLSSFSGSMLLGSILLAVGTLAVGAFIFFGKDLFGEEHRSLVLVLSVVAGLAPLQLLREFSRRWLLANLEVKTSAVLEFGYVTLFLCLLGALVWFAKVSALAVFVIVGIANVLMLIVWWQKFKRRFEFSFDDSKPRLVENVRYGRWVAGENLCSNLTMYLCNWFLFFRISEAAAGVFFACFSIMLLANPFLLGVCSLLGAKSAQHFNSGGWPKLSRTLIQYGCFVVGVLACFSVLLWLRGDWLTNLFFGNKYVTYFELNHSGINRVTPILGLAVPFLGASFVLSCGLWAINRPQDSFVSAVVGLLALVFTFCFVFEPSLVAAAWSFVVACIANMSMRMILLIRARLKNDSGQPDQSIETQEVTS